MWQSIFYDQKPSLPEPASALEEIYGPYWENKSLERIVPGTEIDGEECYERYFWGLDEMGRTEAADATRKWMI